MKFGRTRIIRIRDTFSLRIRLIFQLLINRSTLSDSGDSYIHHPVVYIHKAPHFDTNIRLNHGFILFHTSPTGTNNIYIHMYTCVFHTRLITVEIDGCWQLSLFPPFSSFFYNICKHISFRDPRHQSIIFFFLNYRCFFSILQIFDRDSSPLSISCSKYKKIQRISLQHSLFSPPPRNISYSRG